MAGAYGAGRIVGDDGAISVDNAGAAEALSDAASWVGSIAARLAAGDFRYRIP